MIKKIRFSNFYSFAESATVDFSLGKKPTPTGYDIETDGQRFNKAIAVVGANGSGKTQFLKPLAFLGWLNTQSFVQLTPDEPIPLNPHFFHRKEPTSFEIEFTLEQRDYRYHLELTQQEILSEALFVKTSSQFSYLFKRDKTSQGYSFKQQNFPFNKAVAEKLRGNASIISAAYNYDVAEALPFIEFFRRINSNVGSSGRHHFQHGALLSAAERFNKDQKLAQAMSQAISHFDLGIDSVEIRQLVSRDQTGKEETLWVPFGLHKTDEQAFELPFFEESSGTQSAFVILEPILKTLLQGGIAVIDELDSDLHPHLIPHILEWFEFEHTNPHQAQLIFTCHTPEVLNILQKHQVYLIEKHEQKSNAWRLDEMTGLRADDNLYAKYMSGALGATPEL